MKYKVGDKVRVRGDLKAGGIYGDDVFTGEMEKYKGKIAKIAKETCVGYELEDFMHNWTFEMLRPAKFKIWCETEEEKQAVREELEKEGYVWWNGGEKPTKCIGSNPKCGLYVRDSGLTISYDKDYFNEDDGVELTPSEFTGIDSSEKIIIAKTPTGATASYGDKTVTTEGDFENASRQALAEVLCPFKVGDKAKLKRNGVVGEIIDISGETRVKFYTREDIYDEWCLLSELKPYTKPLYNAKLFCIKGSDVYKEFEEGHIYKIIDGKFNGEGRRYDSLEVINRIFSAQFMEVKGGLDE